MKSDRRDEVRLLATAKEVAARLRLQVEGTTIRVRSPSRVMPTETNGWRAIIGDLGKEQPSLEIWFDLFAGYPERKLYAGFHSEDRRKLKLISKRVTRNLWPTRIVTVKDMKDDGVTMLAKRIRRFEFNMPILEEHAGSHTFYGIFDATRRSERTVSPHFCFRAAAFFEDVARSLPSAKPEPKEREVYPRFENRIKVVSHLNRERSTYLAAECKNRDNFECQVCGLCFEDTYGSLGSEYAEAHHIVPLSQLAENLTTRIEDLATVCANCHRMLHRMDGKREDIKKLRAIVRKHR